MAGPSKGGGKAMLFDFGWSELMLISVVALVVIGPKDLPRAMRTVGYWMRKARSLSQEFQGHVDEMMREAELSEIREDLKKVTEIDLEHQIEETIDPEGSLREGLALPAPEDASQRAREDLLQDAPEGAAQEAPEHDPQEAPEHGSQEAPEHDPQEAPEHGSQEVPEHDPQEAPKHGPQEALGAPPSTAAQSAEKETAAATHPGTPPVPAEDETAAPRP
jgi:sec-independent protein translocase protein TatB